MILCVAVCHDAARMKKKGIDLLAEAARELPDVRVVVIGIAAGVVASSGITLPPNMEILAPVPREELRAWYARAKVYCQPSYTEGLPNSLCEAMLCGCAPVGTAVGGIPSAIADVGWMVPYGRPDELVTALRRALAADEGVHQRARAHIARTFPLHRREDALVKILTEAMQ
jgi:glycosyltransferase involved in cell wall biosynthesis